MDRAILSIPRFTFGVIMLAIGLAVIVAELTSMQFDETASVAGLAGGTLVLVAATLAPRRSKSESATELEDGIGPEEEPALDSDDEAALDSDSEPDEGADT